MSVTPLRWENETLLVLDQRRIPEAVEWLRLTDWRQVAQAIRDMCVRGAPAIGVAAAYGMALAAFRREDLRAAREGLLATRPTAVNLRWALDRIAALPGPSPEAILGEAQRIEREDVEANHAIGRYGASLLAPGSRVLTLCNTGSLATAGFGTALGVIRQARAEGKLELVFACETRPRLQGLRLTAWELAQEDIPFYAIVDGAAGSLMAQRRVDAVIVGADRIAANGDTANKLGTYSLAVLAAHHGLPFIVAAPSSTLDPSTPHGGEIPIEFRPAEEVTHVGDMRLAPEGCPVSNPAFDVTPAAFVTAIVTERGVHRAPYAFT